MRRPKFAKYQLLVHAAALALLAWLIVDAFTGHLSVNPIQDIEQRTGKYALILLVAALTVTPVNIVTGWAPVVRWRRPLGVYALGYAAVHFLAFVGLDYGFRFNFILADVAKKRYIFVGLAALLILLPLAWTSTKGWQKRLGRAWIKLHRLVYLVGALVTVHYLWAVKADWRGPLAYGIVIGAGLALRWPPVRRYFVERRRARRAAHNLKILSDRSSIHTPPASD